MIKISEQNISVIDGIIGHSDSDFGGGASFGDGEGGGGSGSTPDEFAPASYQYSQSNSTYRYGVYFEAQDSYTVTGIQAFCNAYATSFKVFEADDFVPIITTNIDTDTPIATGSIGYTAGQDWRDIAVTPFDVVAGKWYMIVPTTTTAFAWAFNAGNPYTTGGMNRYNADGSYKTNYASNDAGFKMYPSS